MDPINANYVETQEELDDRCASIVCKKQEKAETKIKSTIIALIEERYNHYLPYDILQMADGIFYDNFPNIMKKCFEEEFGEYLSDECEKVFEYYGRNLVAFIHYIGLENIQKVKKEVPKFLESQFNDSNLWCELTFEPLHHYLLEHNGELPPSLTQVQEEMQEANPN